MSMLQYNCEIELLLTSLWLCPWSLLFDNTAIVFWLFARHCVLNCRSHWRKGWTKQSSTSARSWNIKRIINIFPNPRPPAWRKADQGTTEEWAFSQGCWDTGGSGASSSHFTQGGYSLTRNIRRNKNISYVCFYLFVLFCFVFPSFWKAAVVEKLSLSRLLFRHVPQREKKKNQMLSPCLALCQISVI